jgi:hypothetical protein
MKPIVLLLVIKIIAFFASIVSTLGLVSFFFFESLHSYRWHMLVGGLVTIIVTEGISQLITKKISRSGPRPNQ